MLRIRIAITLLATAATIGTAAAQDEYGQCREVVAMYSAAKSLALECKQKFNAEAEAYAIRCSMMLSPGHKEIAVRFGLEQAQKFKVKNKKKTCSAARQAFLALYD